MADTSLNARYTKLIKDCEDMGVPVTIIDDEVTATIPASRSISFKISSNEPLAECKRCVLSQICEIKKSKTTPCLYFKGAYEERKPKV